MHMLKYGGAWQKLNKMVPVRKVNISFSLALTVSGRSDWHVCKTLWNSGYLGGISRKQKQMEVRRRNACPVLTFSRATKWVATLTSEAGFPRMISKRYCRPSLSRTSCSRSLANIASCTEGTLIMSMCPLPLLVFPGELMRSSIMLSVSGVLWSRRDAMVVRAIRASEYCWMRR